MNSQQSTLYFRNGNSDKVYHIHLKQVEAGYVVEFAFGRRGSTLNTGTKTQVPVPYDKAKKIYDQLLTEKTGKGYSPGEEGMAYVRTEHEGRISGVTCQLLNSIEESQLEAFLDDPSWCFQEKFDGKRLLIRKSESGVVEGINRKGLVVGIPASMESAFSGIRVPFIVDGEAVGEKLYVFDVLLYGGVGAEGDDVRSWEYAARLGLLPLVKAQLLDGSVEIVRSCGTRGDKVHLLNDLKSRGKEGVVVKRLAAPYAGGRPASAGDQLKIKFTQTLSAIVLNVNQKRSVTLGLIAGNGEVVVAGNATILPNFPIPPVNSIVEVRYLYAHTQSGKLYQPLYLGERDDIGREDCLTSQLKYKAGSEDDEA